MKRLAVVVAVLLVAVLLWGFLIEPRVIDRRPIDGTIPGLPAAWEGAEVAFLSDFQVGIWLDNIGTAQRMVAQVVEERPDLVLLGGDYVYSDSPDVERQVAAVVDLLRPLTEAGLPTYAVLGNHDVEQDAGDLLERELEAIGIPLLRNEAVPVGPPGEPLHLVAVGPHVPGRDHPSQALSQVPDGAPRLVLMHNPDTFPEFPAGSAPLALAGHTHGGQIRMPFLPTWSYLALVQGGKVTADGFIPAYGEPGNQLYVSRGVGMSVVPMRLNCPPELTVVTLHAA